MHIDVLLIANNESDSALVLRELAATGFRARWRRVDSERGFRDALEPTLDLILADSGLPGWNSLEALAIVKERGWDIPVVVVSTTMGEDAAIAAVRNGAADYVLEDRPKRLGPAVLRLLEEKRERDRKRSLEAERDRAGQALAASERRYRKLFEENPMPMWVYDVETLGFLAVNQAAIEHYGYSCEEFLGMTIAAIRPRADLEALSESILRVYPGLDRSGVWRHLKRDGTPISVEIASHLIEYSGRRAKLVLVNDVTQRVRQEHKIDRLNRIRASNVAIGSAMLRSTDRDELLREACRVAAREGVSAVAFVATPYGAAREVEFIAAEGESDSIELLRCSARLGCPADDRPSRRVIRSRSPFVANDLATDEVMAPFRQPLLDHGLRSGAWFPLIVGNEVDLVFGLLSTEPNAFDPDEVALLEWLCADLSFALEHLEQARRLAHLAYYDALTSLPNSRLFCDRLDQFIHVAEQDSGSVCVATIDIDQFTRVNEMFGRSAGDELLRQVGERLRSHLCEPYTLGRIGGDTFAIASPDGGLVRKGVELRNRILNALSDPFEIGGRKSKVTIQAGFAFYPTDGLVGAEVFKNSETALKMARSRGEREVYYSSEMNDLLAQRRELEEALRIAIETQQFVLHYQPRIDMGSGEIVGAEALIRWQHPVRGLIPPGNFIPLAEETGLIVAIGSWAIGAACAQQSSWLASGIRVVPVAVNLSSLQFERGNLLQTVRDALSSNGVEASHLHLELTESAVMNDPAAAARALQDLRELGIGLSLDDFGTGYSSLAHLKRFPFDAVKIDRSFVSEITSNAEDAAIANAVIAMAHGLKLKVVAEGVETQAQFDYLRQQGCDEMQGWLFSRAVSASEFEEQLRAGRRLYVDLRMDREATSRNS